MGIKAYNAECRSIVMRYASEYWLLAKLIVERISAKVRPKDTVSSIRARNDAVQDDAKSVPTVLDSYDETSMQQVNDLITNFQSVTLK